jgi:hypothetical protein
MALLPSLRFFTRRHVVATLFTAVAVSSALAMASDVKADERVTRALNSLEDVTRENTAWRGLFDAYLDMTPCPQTIGPDFDQVDVWPKMEGWAPIADWAASNGHVGEALQTAADKIVIGLPYGAEDRGIERKYRDAGLVADVRIADGGELTIDFSYLKAFRAFSTWTAAEMYRRFEAGEYQEGFDVAIANARVLRTLCDRHMQGEKAEAMIMLSEALSVLRDGMYSYVEGIPADEFIQVATKELPFLKTADAERVKRLQMPEGDRIVIEALLDEVFAGGSTPDPDRLGKVFGPIQSRSTPLTGFGAARRWERIASVHGSLDASKEKLTNVYDDWWRRWRIRPYDPIQNVPTEFSRLNEVRYAIIAESIADLQSLFDLRDRLIVEINGTVLGCGLCGYRAERGTWPDDVEKAYVRYIPKRFDFDPFDKGYGRFLWTYLGSRKEAVDTDYGRLDVDEFVLYARGRDHEDSSIKESSLDGLTGDMIVWPPLRQLAREQGVID